MYLGFSSEQYNPVPVLDISFHILSSFYWERNFSKVKKISPSLLTRQYTLGILFHFCYLTYIVERKCCLVDPRAHKFVNSELFNVVAYLILDSREDEVNLKRFKAACVVYTV